MSSDTRWTRMWDVFHDALEQPPKQREAFIAAATQEDEALRHHLLNLLRSHEQADGFLESPSSGPRSASASRLFSNDQLPEQIGNYLIVRKIGEGGFADVYEALQTAPVRRTVALKVLKPGMDSRRVIQRFEAERQTLAMLDHPNIATFFDAGLTRDAAHGGRPYFVMEHIAGETITAWCNNRSVDRRARLELFMQACHAVQFAHQKGIIHRDLKPSNILVTDLNGQGQVKVIDFGVAKALDHDAIGQTMHTEHGQFIGTPEYMSPEQAGGGALGSTGGANVDTRTDVFSLGVVLFELLSGKLPREFSGGSLSDTILQLTQRDPRRLGLVEASCRGELEIIVAKALDRDPQRRYQSPAALADDLRAYLEHRPIQARPPSLWRRAAKWSRRNPAPSAALAVGCAAIVFIAGWLFLDHQRDAQQLLLQQQEAFSQATDAVRTYRNQIETMHDRRARLRHIQDAILRYQPVGDDERLEQEQREIVDTLRAHDARFYETLDKLARAERLGIAAEALRPWRARLHMSRYREAAAAPIQQFSLSADRDLHLRLARQHDPDGDVEREFTRHFHVSFTSMPAGATVHLFRLIDQSEIASQGERRLVPVPMRAGELAVTPGTWMLRPNTSSGPLDADDLIVELAGHPIRGSMIVANDVGEIRRFDRLLSIDRQAVIDRWSLEHFGAQSPGTAVVQKLFEFARGEERFTIFGTNLDALGVEALSAGEFLEKIGGPALVWRDGELLEIAAPRGTHTRITSKPLLLCAQSRVGITPSPELDLIEGDYLAAFELEGYVSQRVPLQLGLHGAVATREVHATLVSVEEGRDGMVWIAPAKVDAPEPFWMMEREITMGEYLEFLNQPETLAQIENSPAKILVPRLEHDPFLHRDESGQFVLRDDWNAAWPVLYISWHDARAYAAWRTSMLRNAGEHEWHFDLPTYHEWTAAWGGDRGDCFPWGETFRTRWVSNNYARPTPWPEPVMTYPIDETDLAVYDMSGSASEWLNAYWLRDRGYVGFAGGSWGHGGVLHQTMFKMYGANGLDPARTSGTVGFRLVLRKGSTPPSPEDLPDVYHSHPPPRPTAQGGETDQPLD